MLYLCKVMDLVNPYNDVSSSLGVHTQIQGLSIVLISPQLDAFKIQADDKPPV